MSNTFLEQRSNGAVACGTLLILIVLAAAGCSATKPQAGGAISFPSARQKPGVNSGPTGPTLRLDYGQKDSPGNPIASFMYFVPLISPEPVAIVQSPGNTQRARILSVARRESGNQFSAVCEFAITGEGTHDNIFVHSELIRQNERRLQEGGELNRYCSFANAAFQIHAGENGWHI